LWPGRVSAILKNKALDKKTIQIDDSIAIRMPDDKFLQTIIKKLKKPIISTSLNISKQPVLMDLIDIEKYFTEHQPDLAVDIGVIKNKKPSKLIDIKNIEDIKILRK
jgi:L-threonylcarbamoyladenylate synthase